MHAPTTIVLPITTAQKTRLPTHLFIGKSGGLAKESLVLGEQPMTIDKKRIKQRIGHLQESLYKDKLDKVISISLGLQHDYTI